MKQILQSYKDGELWLAETPAPSLQAGGVIVRTAYSVVSAGTERMVMELAKKSLVGKAQARPDLVKKVFAKMKSEGFAQTLNKVFAKLDTPITLGYSCAGVVSEVGRSVNSVSVGDRVACAGAGYATHAEINYVPRNLCVRVPDAVSSEDAAFTTLGAIAMQGVRQADVRVGECVAVVGLGLLGLLSTQILKASGCRVLGVDPDASRCKRARELGADYTAAPNAAVAASKDLSQGYGVDVVILTASTPSNQPIEDAAEMARVRGKVVVVGVVGMDVPRGPFYQKELDLRLSMSYGPGRYDADYEERGQDYPYGYVRWTEQRNMSAFLNLVADELVTPAELVTHSFALDHALTAYALLEDPSSSEIPPLGILLSYPDHADESRAVHRSVQIKPASGPNGTGLGVIGAGNFAKGVLLPTLRKTENVTLRAICTKTGISASQVGKKFGFEQAATDVDEILSSDQVQAVLIATRHDSHADLVCRSLRAGKHVFVEKPLAIKASELADVEQACADSTCCLMVGFNRRFSSHAQAVREAVAGREPVTIQYTIQAGALDDGSWVLNPEEGGGRIVGEVCHFVDLCGYIAGSDATRVYAERVADGGQDGVMATIRYANGALASINYLTQGAASLPKERIEVSTSGLTACIDDFRKTTFHGLDRDPIKGKQDKGFEAEIAAFVQTVKNGGDAPISNAELFQTTRICIAILDSIEKGQPVAV